MVKVHVNGALVAPEDAMISVFDHGLITGDGVFETILLHRHRPFALVRHLERLKRSADGLGVEAPAASVISSAIDQVVGTAEFDTGWIRVTVTSGPGPLGSVRGDGPATLVVAAEPLDLDRPPADVAVVPWTRNEKGGIAGLKTISYAENARALQYAHDHGADEAIFQNSVGMLCEGTGSNVFVVIDGELLTPPIDSGCLDGVTRQLVLEHRGGKERDVPAARFISGRLDEAFLTSTLRGVQPIASIDGATPAEVRGPETEKAIAAYAALLESNDEV
jgi:branched-chain amino acid aminotransferase